MMKKLIALLLALVMVLSLAACGGGKEETAKEPETKATEAPKATLSILVSLLPNLNLSKQLKKKSWLVTKKHERLRY